MEEQYIEEPSIWDRISASYRTLTESCRIIVKHPVFILPILIGMILHGAFFFVMYKLFKQFYPTMQALPENELNTTLLITICVFTLILTSIHAIISFLQLELIQQIETGKDVNINDAIHETIFKDLPKGLLIIIVQTIISTFMSMIRRASRRMGTRPFRRDLNRVTTGAIQDFTNMVVFFIYPAIAWEDKKPIEAAKKSIHVIRNLIPELVFGFIQIDIIIAIIIMVFVVTIGIYALFPHYGHFSKSLVLFWGVFISLLFGELIFYLEQMLAANLYLWNLKYEKAVVKAVTAKLPLPSLYSIERPSLLDDIPDLLH